MNNVEIQLILTREKIKGKIELENLRHKNTMEELEYMAKHKITAYMYKGRGEKPDDIKR